MCGDQRASRLRALNRGPGTRCGSTGPPPEVLLTRIAIDKLEQDGPTLGRPLVDKIKGSPLHNLKELRSGSAGTSEVRILFIFDPARRAVLLVAGDKSGRWQDWYDEAVPVAEKRYERWMEGEGDE
ncbi:type II toxin-antitoxin system RelE/ParE family toxin [Pseudonocardia sp. T1-2H]|uniref:type II toxin-antitoxin system RelE/ParE family toxin n=1 Tax=Pseudonocardia sp. T1-2H TaxID=3128899 RepID=UPI0031013F2D